MTDDFDPEQTNPDSPSSWRVLGYTDDGAEVAVDGAGRRWITEPLFGPMVGEVSFSDSDLEDFLEDPANYGRGATTSGDPRDGREWSLAQVGVYLGVSHEVAAALCAAVGADADRIRHRDVTEMVRLGWVDQEGPALFPEDITAGLVDHVWADVATANRLLELDDDVFELLLERGLEGKGFPCAVVVDLPGAGVRVDVTETRISLWLGGLHLRRVLASSEAPARLALLESLEIP